MSYNGQMGGPIAAAIGAVIALALTACAGSSTSQLQRAERGVGAGRIALLHEVRAARASDSELSIFPLSSRARSSCLIPITLGGVHPVSPPPLHGICQTGVHFAQNRHEPLTVVVFSEKWRWRPYPCPPGVECPLQLPRTMRFHSWIVWVKPPTTLSQKPLVLGTHQRGEVAPQAPKP